MHVFVCVCVCVLIYAVHKDNGTSGSSVSDVALPVGFGLYRRADDARCSRHRNQPRHRLYIDRRYPAGPWPWGPPTGSREEEEEEEEERWEVKKAAVKRERRRDGTERVSKLEQTTGETGDYRGLQRPAHPGTAEDPPNPPNPTVSGPPADQPPAFSLFIISSVVSSFRKEK